MTAKRKLIRRNAHKMIAKIFEDSTTAKVYTLNNGFVGESIGVEWVKKHTANIDHAEHYDNLNGTYTIRIHSNLWYELASENTEPDVTHEQHSNIWFIENQELVNRRIALDAMHKARASLAFGVNDSLKKAKGRGVDIEEIAIQYGFFMDAIVTKINELMQERAE